MPQSTMIRILNCFKTTPDFDAVPEADWASGAATGVFDFSYIKQEIDPYSESGLELVLRAKDAFLKESHQGSASDIHLTALTFGPAVSEKALRTLAALGYDECVRIDGTPDPFQAEQTAAAIAAYCRQTGPYDLIVLGGQSPDGGNKKMPYLLTEYLPWYTEQERQRPRRAPCEKEQREGEQQRDGGCQEFYNAFHGTGDKRVRRMAPTTPPATVRMKSTTEGSPPHCQSLNSRAAAAA